MKKNEKKKYIWGRIISKELVIQKLVGLLGCLRNEIGMGNVSLCLVVRLYVYIDRSNHYWALSVVY